MGPMKHFIWIFLVLFGLSLLLLYMLDGDG